MQYLLTFLLATTALAAPAANINKQKQHSHSFGTFKVDVPSRSDILRNVDTAHEMSRIIQKFDLGVVLPAVEGASEKLKVPGLPDIPDFVTAIPEVIESILHGVPTTTKSTKSSSSAVKHHKTSATGIAGSSVVPTAPSSFPSYTSILSVPAVTSAVAVSSVIIPPVTTSAESTESAESTAESSAPEPTVSATDYNSAAAPESTYSSAFETSSAAPEPTETSSMVETSTIAPDTSAPAPSTAAPETTSISTTSTTEASSSAPETTPVPMTSTPEAATSAPATSTPETTFTPSFTFAPSTTEIPSSTLATSTKKAAATVGASPEHNDSEYLSPVTIGGQTLTLDFDTGSADLWVFSNKLSADQIGGHAAFDPTKSSTWSAADGYTWKISYGDGSGASGTVGYDVVEIGGATATRQAVEIATSVAATFVKDTNNDGLVGLGFSVINTIKPTAQQTFFENIIGDLEQPLFTADLRQDSAGSYEFGTIDAAKYTGDIHYTSIDSSKGFWQFPSTSYTIGGQTYQIPNAAPAVADTGTSIVLADASAVQAYYAQVPNSVLNTTAGGYTYPCGTTLPDYGIAIGDSGFVATIPGSQVTYAADGTSCFGGIQPNTGIQYQILGDTLLKQYFAVFNGGAKTFGIAQKA